MDECRARVKRALSSPGSGSNPDARRDMKLYTAFGASLLYTRGPVPETGAAWTRALEIAERLADAEYRLRALWGLWTCQHTTSAHIGPRWPSHNVSPTSPRREPNLRICLSLIE